MLKTNHINPDLARYELHRVWVVDAKLKPGQRHLYSRRTLYVDEDSWHILAIDYYDSRGQLCPRPGRPRHQLLRRARPVDGARDGLRPDNGRYLALGLDNEEPRSRDFAEAHASPTTSRALQRRGVR